MNYVHSLSCLLLLCLATVYSKKITAATEDNCEVCVKFLKRFDAGLDDSTRKDVAKIESSFKDFCRGTKKRENTFCYYIGGLEESATNILREMSKPLSFNMPADKVCMKLYNKDEQICDLRYQKEVDLSSANFKKMKVRELKDILNGWDEQCKGCTEKQDYIKLIEDLMPKHAPESHKKRSAKKEL